MNINGYTEESLLDTNTNEDTAQAFPTSKMRWWVLLWYSYISALQSLIWMTFSSVPDESKEYLDCGSGTLNLFLNEGPIMFCIWVFFASWLVSQRNGLRISVRLGATLCFLASLLRCVPLLMSSEQRATRRDLIVAIIHIAQIINASVAPLIVASPSFLSMAWFPVSERNTATAISNTANAFGRAVGFFLGPALVKKSSDIPLLLLVEAGLAALPCLCTWLSYPNQPEHPPSQAAAAEREAAVVSLSDESSPSVWLSLRASLDDVVAALRTPSFKTIVFAGGLQMGIYGAWSGVLTSVLTPEYSNSTAGYFGLANTLAGIVGGLCIGRLADARLLPLNLHQYVLVLSLLGSVSFLLLAFALHPYMMSPFASSGLASLLTICSLAGFFRGGTDPLYFELSAEVVYPLPVSVAGGILTFFYHVTAVMTLSIPSDILNKWTMTIMAACLGLCFVLISFVDVKYQRK